MKRALVFWFTGLSGSGKTTIADGAKKLLEDKGLQVLVLDGDDVRNRLHIHLGFSAGDIKENNRLILEMCEKYRDSYDVILVPIISPYSGSRQRARESLKERFYEIYFSADLKTVVKRDVKGLYSKAGRKELDNLIGFSPGSTYEPPAHPDFVVDSENSSQERSIIEFSQFVLSKLK